MNDSTSPMKLQAEQERSLLVVRTKLKRVVIGSLISVAVLGVFTVILLGAQPTAPGKPDYRTISIVVCLLLMPISVTLYSWARHALRLTLTATSLYLRSQAGWFVRRLFGCQRSG